MAAPTGEKHRSQQTVRDLIISMVLVGLFVAFLFLMVLRPSGDPVREVDTAQAAQVAAQAQTLDILVPQGLGEGWRATSARYRPGPAAGTGSWFNGYIDPNGEFVAVAEQNYDRRDFLRTYLEDAEQLGARPVGDEVWLEFRNADKGEWTLVLESSLAGGTGAGAEAESAAGASSGDAAAEGLGGDAAVTEGSAGVDENLPVVLVTGTAPPEELAVFAGKLAPFAAG